MSAPPNTLARISRIPLFLLEVARNMRYDGSHRQGDTTRRHPFSLKSTDRKKSSEKTNTVCISVQAFSCAHVRVFMQTTQ